MLKLGRKQDFNPPQLLRFQLCGKHCEDAAPLFLQAHKKACQQKVAGSKVVPFRVQSQASGARGALFAMQSYEVRIKKTRGKRFFF